MEMPVITGLESLDSIHPEANTHMFGVERGVKCLIMNDKICDLNGKPYGNRDFQSDFESFAKRLRACKTIGFATIVDTGASSEKDYMFIEKLKSDTKWYLNHRDDVKIIAEDLFNFSITNFVMQGRYALLSSMITGAKAEDKDIRVELPSHLHLEKFDRKRARDFATECIEGGKTIVVKNSSSIYMQGEFRLAECRSFVLEPFETFSLNISRFTEEKVFDYYLNEEVNVVSTIYVLYGKKEIPISYKTAQLTQSQYLLDLLKEDKLKRLSIRAIELGDELKYCTKI